MMNDLNDPTHFFILTIQSNPSPQTEIQTFSCPTSSIPTIEIHYVQFIPNHTNLSRLCFAKHNAAHHDERTMSHSV